MILQEILKLIEAAEMKQRNGKTDSETALDVLSRTATEKEDDASNCGSRQEEILPLIVEYMLSLDDAALYEIGIDLYRSSLTECEKIPGIIMRFRLVTMRSMASDIPTGAKAQRCLELLKFLQSGLEITDCGKGNYSSIISLRDKLVSELNTQYCIAKLEGCEDEATEGTSGAIDVPGFRKAIESCFPKGELSGQRLLSSPSKASAVAVQYVTRDNLAEFCTRLEQGPGKGKKNAQKHAEQQKKIVQEILRNYSLEEVVSNFMSFLSLCEAEMVQTPELLVLLSRAKKVSTQTSTNDSTLDKYRKAYMLGGGSATGWDSIVSKSAKELRMSEAKLAKSRQQQTNYDAMSDTSETPRKQDRKKRSSKSEVTRKPRSPATDDDESATDHEDNLNQQIYTSPSRSQSSAVKKAQSLQKRSKNLANSFKDPIEDLVPNSQSSKKIAPSSATKRKLGWNSTPTKESKKANTGRKAERDDDDLDEINTVEQYTSQRKRAVPWEDEETEKLQEGMRIFSDGSSARVAWKDIYIWGKEVFDRNNRNPMALKDRWRILIKRM